MDMPAFTAESSLYKTNGHYWTGRHAVNSSAPMVSPVWPAVREQEGEVINVHGCPVGWTDWGGTCYPPLTEPPVGGGGGEGEVTPPGGGQENGGPYGRGNGKGKEKSRWEKVGGRVCGFKDFPGGDLIKAELDCFHKETKQHSRFLVCWDNPPEGMVSPSCCYENKKNKSTFCIHAEEVPPQ